MKELENLLTSLVERGRKPKDREVVSIKLDQEFTKSEGKTVFYCSCKDWFWFYADLRWIVSLESGLWQFVCENKMCKNQTSIYRWYKKFWSKEEKACRGDHYEYRLLESALLPEEELSQFLLSNIVIEWNSSPETK